MSLISFSVLRDKVESGAKAHTIRFRAEPPTVGEYLHLWWKSRTKERELMGVSVCTRVDSVKIEAGTVAINGKQLTDKQINKLALADGFNTLEDFWIFFKDDPGEGWLIWWEPDYITKRRILPEVQSHARIENDIISQPPRLYYPSNGTEGMQFESVFCSGCSREKSCFVFLQALNNGASKHWLVHERRPVCTVFTNKKKIKVRKKREQKEQLTLNFL